MRRRSLALLLALATGGAGAGREPPAATPAGPPVHCIAIARIAGTRVRSDAVIDFAMRDGRTYRNTLPGGGCPGLGAERRFAYATALDRLCAADQVTVLTGAPVGRGATCALGPFRPVALAARRR